MSDTNTGKAGLAKQLLLVLAGDLPRLERIDNYEQGLHDYPYMPPMADDEYRVLANRSVSNWCPLLVDTPAQAMYVDSFRPGRTINEVKNAKELISKSPEWTHWQESRLDARQVAVHRGALKFGHSFTLTEKLKNGKIRTKGLSAMRTAALYEDPANDDTPYAAITVTLMPKAEQRGRARMFDGRNEYQVTFKSLTDHDGITVSKGKPHGANECPITRFAAAVDLEGRTLGVIEPMIVLQNRINQTVFDLLVAQTYASINVRTATGMAPPMQQEAILDDDGQPTGEFKVKTDANGRPMPATINHNAKRFLFAEDPDVKFDSLPASPLDGFISSIDMSIRHLAAISQTPPHHLLGQIANLSAEALQAAETALSRKIEEFKKCFGESWERVFRLAAEMSGETGAAEDYSGEVLWRDMEQRSLAQSADALGKLAEALGIPKKGLWSRVPGVTKNELDEWERIYEEDPEIALASSLNRSSASVVDFPLDDTAVA